MATGAAQKQLDVATLSETAEGMQQLYDKLERYDATDENGKLQCVYSAPDPTVHVTLQAIK